MAEESDEKTGNGAASKADFAEKLLQRTALGVFVVSIAFVLDIAATYAEGTFERVLDVLSYAMSLAVVLLIFPVFWTYVRKYRGMRDPIDSFVAEAYRTACVRSFEATFITMVFLDLAVSKFFPDISAAIVVEGMLALSLAVMSLTFFFLNRRSDGDEDWDGDDHEGDETS